MRFIAVSRPAAADLISDRTTQSVEYETGRTLAIVLQNTSLDAQLSPRILLSRHEDGLFFISASESSSDYIVFDLHTCQIFSHTYSPADALLYFQKVLRFATKIWNNLKLSVSEKP